MKMVVVSVYDGAAQAFGRPVFVNSVGQAIRSFQDEVQRNASDNDLFKHPEDFTLYHLGAFDDNLGVFEQVGSPAVLLRGKDAAITEQ